MKICIKFHEEVPHGASFLPIFFAFFKEEVPLPGFSKASSTGPRLSLDLPGLDRLCSSLQRLRRASWGRVELQQSWTQPPKALTEAELVEPRSCVQLQPVTNQ